jgi:pimeloyl-ACP methyl ester carboxylesterase
MRGRALPASQTKEPVRGEFIDIGGERLYYYAAGTRGVGEPLLLIHGFATSSHLWTRVVPLLPPGHRIVVPDLLGFGRSELRHQDVAATDLGISGHATRGAQLLDALQIDRICVVGHGWGAAIAVAMSARQPQRVSRMCLINAVTAASWPQGEARRVRAAMPLLYCLPSGMLLGLTRRKLASAYRDTPGPAQTATQYLRPFRGALGRRTLLAHLRSLTVSPDSTNMGTPRASRPTAIVWGAHDPLLPMPMARRLQASIQGSTLDVVAGGHFSPEESPEQVATVLARLLHAQLPQR